MNLYHVTTTKQYRTFSCSRRAFSSAAQLAIAASVPSCFTWQDREAGVTPGAELVVGCKQSASWSGAGCAVEPAETLSLPANACTACRLSARVSCALDASVACCTACTVRLKLHVGDLERDDYRAQHHCSHGDRHHNVRQHHVLGAL